MKKFIAGLFAVPVFGLANSALAAYVFTSIDYPGSTFTDTFGINNTGQIAIGTDVGGSNTAFVYKNGSYNTLPAPPAGIGLAAVGINDAGSVVGGAFGPTGTESGFILSGGTYQYFTQSGWINTEARAIGNSGLVTGLSYNADAFALGGSVGFIYNPLTGAFTNIVPAANTKLILAQGINAANQAVGSFQVLGTPGQTAFLRQSDGTISTFRINDASTAARGINDTGLITGFVDTPTGLQAWVGNSAGFELLQCPASACPGVTQTFGEGINNAGQIVGGWNDSAGGRHGFIATPAALPTGTTSGGAYVFSTSVIGGVPIWIDPLVAIGYDYAIGTGDPLISSVTLPIGIGDSLYTLIVGGGSFDLAGGDLFDFTTHGFQDGVSAFRVTGIETSAGLDPTNSQAFATELTFVDDGTFTGTMTPLTENVPEPATLALLTLGLAGLGFSRRRKQ